MDSPELNHRQLGIFMLIGLAIFLLLNLPKVFETRTVVVFCDVGQGDAIYLRIDNKIDLLIDAGPDRKIIDCLSKHMPFFDRTIEAAFISHPQADHFNGFTFVLDRYHVQNLYVSKNDFTKSFYRDLILKFEKAKTKITLITAGTSLGFNRSTLSVLWPTQKTLQQTTPSVDTNYFSQILLFKEGAWTILFTGDAQMGAVSKLSSSIIEKIDVIKIPHHGSKKGLTPGFLKLAEPKVSVISVGVKNRFGHPADSTLELLKALKSQIRRTDKEGDIIFRLN